MKKIQRKTAVLKHEFVQHISRDSDAKDNQSWTTREYLYVNLTRDPDVGNDYLQPQLLGTVDGRITMHMSGKLLPTRISLHTVSWEKAASL